MRQLIVLVVVCGLGLFTATTAQAAPSTITCGAYGQTPSFSCVSSSGFSGQRPWGYPVDSQGHNCTNYVSYRLNKNGVSNPGNLGDAYQWDNNASARNIVVNNTPTVGSVAVWEVNSPPATGSGHVAYVESVNSDGSIETTEDNYGGTTMSRHLHPASEWPNHFIHFGDVAPNPPGSSVAFTGVGSATYKGTSLVAGQQLHANEYLASPDGRYVLLMQPDGNLVVYTTSGSVWSLGYAGNPGAFLFMQTDGNLALYNANQVALWSTGQRGSTNLQMQNDANLVTYNANSVVTWQSGVTRSSSGTTPFGSNQLVTGQRMNKMQYLRSSNGRYTLVLQSDGNLVLYAPGYRTLWNSGTGGQNVSFLLVQGDGNTVLYTDSYFSPWNTNAKGGNNINTFRVQDDGNLVGYGGTPPWNTGTSGT